MDNNKNVTIDLFRIKKRNKTEKGPNGYEVKLVDQIKDYEVK